MLHAGGRKVTLPGGIWIWLVDFFISDMHSDPFQSITDAKARKYQVDSDGGAISELRHMPRARVGAEGAMVGMHESISTVC